MARTRNTSRYGAGLFQPPLQAFDSIVGHSSIIVHRDKVMKYAHGSVLHALLSTVGKLKGSSNAES
uniref:Uncharacterized protein n=1 Tax=Pristionchus pacificus TaxID=54126 RepID=A0A2A6C6F2_PRIPA|eukprot:PDM73633.1 hypothetical protein PRIPAC_40989 [Pristionchus pacificus]